MGTCTLAKSVQENPFARDLSQQFAKMGVTCPQMDAGHAVLNFSGKECPKKGDATCIVGRSDGVVEAEEILEYAFDRYEKYQALLGRVLPRPLPWALDDLDPTTTFDAEVRKKVGDAIAKLKGILKKNKLKAGTEEYKEKLATGLLYFAAAKSPSGAAAALFIDELGDRLDDNKLTAFKEHVDSTGGFYLSTDYEIEQSAIDAIKRGRGKCTENSSILYAIMKMAGLSPQFIFAEYMDPRIIEKTGPFAFGMYHHCVGLRIKGKLRLFDSSFAMIDPKHVNVHPLTPRQFYAFASSNLGSDAHYGKNPAKALSGVLDAIAVDSRCFVAYGHRGNILVRKRQSDAAMADYERGLRIHPHNAAIYNQQGLLWQDMKRYRKAIESFTHVIRLIPKGIAGYGNRGQTWELAGDYDKAIADYTRALELDPTLVDGYRVRARVWYRKGDRDKAIEDFGHVLYINPSDAATQTFRGNCWFEKGNLEKAFEDYSEAITSNPKLDLAYVGRCRVWTKRGKPEKALADCEKALEINPREEEAYESRGFLWLAMKQPDRAIADFTKALALKSKLPKSYSGRADAWAMKGENAKAQADRERARAIEKSK